MDWGDYEDVRVALNALRQAGPFNPAQIGPALQPMLESEHWRNWISGGTGRQKAYPDFDSFVESETQHRVDVILVALRGDPAKRYEELAKEIESIRRDRIAGAGPKEGGDPTLSNTKGHVPQARQNADAVIARLKRDDPDLAEQVIAGKVTPHAAAVQAGIRRPRAYVRTDDVGKAVEVLLRYYDKNEILEALS